MCLGFETINMKDMSSFGYTEEFFLIDNGNLLLTCSAGTDVISTQGYKRLKSWQSSKPTIFANSKFQICADSIHTPSKIKKNPLKSQICKACEHQLGVVIASTTQLAILDQHLEIVKFIDESLIMSVFSEGYATQSSLVFFSGDVHVFSESTIVSVEKDLETLIVLFLNGKAVYSVAGGPFVDCNFGWPATKFIRNCGSGVQIFGENESVLLHNNEFSKLYNCTGMLLTSKDMESCFTFTNGMLERKAVIGLVPRLTNFLNIYKKEEVLWVASKDLVTSWVGKVITITSLSTNRTQTVELPEKSPPRIYYCWAISESVVLCVFRTVNVSKLVTYRTADMELIDVMGVPHMALINDIQEMIRICGSTLFVSHNANECSWVSIYNIHENGHIAEDPRNKSLEAHVNVVNSNPYLCHLQLHNYPEKGDYLLYAPISEPLALIPMSSPQTQQSIPPSRSGERCTPVFTQSKEDDKTYFVAYSIEKSSSEDEFRLVKLSVNGNEELITSFSKRRITSIKLLECSGEPIKYQPSFIVSADDGSLFTVAILPKEEAKQLAAIQQEIVGIPKKKYGIPRVDAQTLKRIVDDPTTHPTFEKHGINVAEFKANLTVALK